MVSFIWTTPNIFGVLAPCLALCWTWPSVSFSDVELISEPRASTEQAAPAPGQAPACLWLFSVLLAGSPAAAFPLIPTNRQRVRRLPARQAGLQNADKLLPFIRGPDEGFGEALNYIQGVGFLGSFFSSSTFINSVFWVLCFATNVPPSLPPFSPPFLKTLEIKSDLFMDYSHWLGKKYTACLVLCEKRAICPALLGTFSWPCHYQPLRNFKNLPPRSRFQLTLCHGPTVLQSPQTTNADAHSVSVSISLFPDIPPILPGLPNLLALQSPPWAHSFPTTLYLWFPLSEMLSLSPSDLCSDITPGRPSLTSLTIYQIAVLIPAWWSPSLFPPLLVSGALITSRHATHSDMLHLIDKTLKQQAELLILFPQIWWPSQCGWLWNPTSPPVSTSIHPCMPLQLLSTVRD